MVALSHQAPDCLYLHPCRDISYPWTVGYTCGVPFCLRQAGTHWKTFPHSPQPILLPGYPCTCVLQLTGHKLSLFLFTRLPSHAHPTAIPVYRTPYMHLPTLQPAGLPVSTLPESCWPKQHFEPLLSDFAPCVLSVGLVREAPVMP